MRIGASAPVKSRRAGKGKLIPVSVILLALLVIWYVATVWLNLPWERDVLAREGREASVVELVVGTLSQDRPVLPSPHQVAIEVYDTTIDKKISSKRSLVYHAGITLSSSMLIVVLNAVGVQGLLPKAFISMYLSFFPIVVGMVKGLTSPDRSHLDLMKTYNASGWQSPWKLRLPSSLPYLFTSYGQTVQIWSALVVASLLAGVLVALVGWTGQLVNRRMGLERLADE